MHLITNSHVFLRPNGLNIISEKFSPSFFFCRLTACLFSIEGAARQTQGRKADEGSTESGVSGHRPLHRPFSFQPVSEKHPGQPERSQCPSRTSQSPGSLCVPKTMGKEFHMVNESPSVCSSGSRRKCQDAECKWRKGVE